MPGARGPKTGWKERIIRYLIGIPIFLGVYLVLTLLYTYPNWPNDSKGWGFLILVGISVSVCLEWIGESVFSEKVGFKISAQRISRRRMILSVLLFFICLSILILLLFAFASFVRHHLG